MAGFERLRPLPRTGGHQRLVLVDDLDEFAPIGSESSGGAFVLLPAGQVLYVASEGRAGIIAASFEELIQLVVACPYWPDILKYSAGGDIDEMRRAAQMLESMLENEERYQRTPAGSCSAELDLPSAERPDPVGALLCGGRGLRRSCRARTSDGAPFTTLRSIVARSTSIRCCATPRHKRRSDYFAHSPLRNTGSLLPSARNAVDVGLGRTDHPVDVNEALVSTLRRDLLRRDVAPLTKHFESALAERDMRGRVLVEQRVEKQQPAPAKSAMNAAPAPPSPSRRAPSSVSSTLFEHLRAARGLCVDDLAVLEAHRDVVDQRALVGQRLRGRHGPRRAGNAA